MGVICPCGVLVNAFSERNNVKFDGHRGTIKGSITYMADVCVTTLEASTLSLSFVDTETPNANNFLFTANGTIKSVTCKREGQNCVVTVSGTGLMNGQSFPFEAVFRDMNPNAKNDNVQSFVITGFFDQNGAATVPQGSIVALDCQKM